VKIQGYIILSCIGSWALVSLLVPEAAVEILLGMLSPLLLAMGTRILVDRTYRKAPPKTDLAVDPSFYG